MKPRLAIPGLLALLVLAFLASLAFAQLLVYQRAARKPLRLHTPSARDALPQLPPGFHPDTATDFGDFPPVAAYRGTVAGQPRSLRIYLATIKSFDDPACPLRGEALGLYNQLFHAKPASTTASMLGTRGALELEGPVASSPQVASRRCTWAAACGAMRAERDSVYRARTSSIRPTYSPKPAAARLCG